jgi:deazaflavin-dependent oxidoreductase (nitroreductase family)
MMTDELSALAREAFCYLTTTGRISGRPHTIEIWFALRGTTCYMLAGGKERADWVKNARRQPAVTMRIGQQTFPGQAREVETPDEDALARQLIGGKYGDTEDDLEEWLQSALPIAVDLEVE